MDEDHSDTIKEFCQRERISRGTYYNLRRVGKGPREMLVGSVKRISPEARVDWRRERESEAAAAGRQ
jgi:hypothetical protein